MLEPVLAQDLEGGLVIQLLENLMLLEREKVQAQGLKLVLVLSMGHEQEDVIELARMLEEYDY